MIFKIARRLLPYVFLAWAIRMLFVHGNEPIGKAWPYIVIPFAIGLAFTIGFDIISFRKKDKKS